MAKKKTYMAGMSAEERALIDYQNAGQDFIDGGAAKYNEGEDLDWTNLGPADAQTGTGLNDITTDPAYRTNELEALRQLGEQSKDGYSARDKADLARIEQRANSSNKGRQGAIEQQVQSRGLGGSGLEFALKQQAAQDAAEQEAMAGLEKNAQMQERKQSATAQLGSLSSQLQGRDFSQEAQKASAQDSINRFNTQNTNSTSQYNNQGVNNAANQNWDRANQTSDNQTNANYAFNKDSLGVNQDNATKSYDYATDMYNRAQAKKAADAKKKSGIGSAVGGVVGGVAGAYVGGPAGATAGASVGSSVGGSIASDENLKKDVAPENELNIEAFLSSISPKSYSYKDENKPRHGVIAQDLATTKIGSDMVREDENGMKHIDVNDAVSALLQAVAHLNKKIGK